MKKTKEHLINQMTSLEALVFNKTGEDRQEQLKEAQKICTDILLENPENPYFICMRGIVDFHLGQREAGEDWMEKAFILAPQSIVIIYNYALILMDQKKFAAALPLMMRFVALKPDHAKAYWCIGKALRETGDSEGALAAFNKSLEINPQDTEALNDMRNTLAEAWSDKGTTLKEIGRLPEAATCYEQALALKPDHHGYINNLGVIHFLQNDLDGAEALYQEALTIQPAFPDALCNLGAILGLKGDLDGAILNFQKALALRPDYPVVLNNLGNALKDAKRFEEAIATYKDALRIEPDNAEVHKDLALALLALGRFDEGWRESEWRWKSKQQSHDFRDFAQPEWQGEAGHGRTLLIHAEQGFGDTLQFCRYAPLVKERGFHVVMEVPLPLKRIIHSLDGVEEVVTSGDVLPSFDLHCPMMNLPLAFHTTLDTIPATLPYLSPDPADSAKWRDRVAALANDALKVGLVWAGSSRAHLQSPHLIAIDRKRSVAPEVLAPLMDVPDVQFFSLQKEGTRAPDAFHLIDWMADCHDFADTAALIMNLDLVISVDTAVAHLAGALGKPVWLLNRFNSCWRWLAQRDDSPWYPRTLCLFHQKEMGNWDEVILRVRAALAERHSVCLPVSQAQSQFGEKIIQLSGIA
jgi:Flp pilus assembly protein TadD